MRGRRLESSEACRRMHECGCRRESTENLSCSSFDSTVAPPRIRGLAPLSIPVLLQWFAAVPSDTEVARDMRVLST